MPSSTPKQARYFAAAYGRKKAGKPRAGDPKMSADEMREWIGVKDDDRKRTKR